MPKGGESLGNEESSEEEEEVIPALNHTPGVRPLAPGVVFFKNICLKISQNRLFDKRIANLPMAKLRPGPIGIWARA